jgi:L-fucose isomerase-like protein
MRRQAACPSRESTVELEYGEFTFARLSVEVKVVYVFRTFVRNGLVETE